MTQPGRGGYRPPRNPAPAPMPGRLSRRTDGGPADRQPARELPDARYGEAKDFREIQSGAPMAGAGEPGVQVAPVDLSRVTTLDVPSQRTGEPVTAGAARGDGPGLSALALTAGHDPGVRAMAAYLPGLEIMANMPSASQGFRQWVRRLRAMM